MGCGRGVGIQLRQPAWAVKVQELLGGALALRRLERVRARSCNPAKRHGGEQCADTKCRSKPTNVRCEWGWAIRFGAPRDRSGAPALDPECAPDLQTTTTATSSSSSTTTTTSIASTSTTNDDNMTNDF